MNEPLLIAAQAGDRRALDALLALHRERVFRYGLRVCRTTEDAEDAVQQTLWAASRAIGGFRGASSVSTWLFAIVRRECLRLDKDPFYADLDEVAPALADPARGPEEAATRREVAGILADGLSRLSPAEREVLLLRDVQGLTAPEAAQRLGIGVHALKSRLHRARAALRAAVHDAPRESGVNALELLGT